MKDDKQDLPGFNWSGFFQFLAFLIIGIIIITLGLFFFDFWLHLDDKSVGETIVCLLITLGSFAWILIIIEEFNKAFPKPRPKLSENFWMRYVVAPVIVGVILGIISYVFTGEFTVGGGGVALIGSIITIIAGSKT